MEGIPATYLGRIVSKDHFRVFIYAPGGLQKLVNSWDEYEAHMQGGLWFATKDEAKLCEESLLTAAKTDDKVHEKKTKPKKSNIAIDDDSCIKG